MAAIYGGLFLYGMNSYGNLPTITNYFTPPVKLPRDALFYRWNGTILPTTADTDLHLVADDLTVGSNWPSRVGTYVASLNGQPDIGVETPLYPSGGFYGSGYRSGTTGYGFSDYYALPGDASHKITSSESISYEIIYRVGHGTSNQNILSLYLFPDYNIRVKMIYSDGSYYINAYVGMNVVSADVSALVEPYTYNFIHVLWNAASSSISVGINGVFNSANGIGAVVVPITDPPLQIGCDSNFIDYNTNGQIIEIMRHRALMSTSDAVDRVRTFAGMSSYFSNVLPQYYERQGRGEVFVNGKIFSFGSNFPRMSGYGLLQENFVNGFLKNNFFEQDLTFLDQWNYFTSGTSTITSYSDSDSFTEIGGQGFKMSMDNIGSVAYVYQDTATQYQANYRVWVDIWLKSIDSGCYPLFYVYNLVNGHYYDIDNGVWSASPVANIIRTSSTNLEKFSFTMVNEGVNASYRYSFQGYETADNYDKSYVIYGINDNMSEQKQEVKVNRSNSNVRVFDYLRYPKTMLNMDKDQIDFTLTYLSDASYLPYSYMTRYIFADSAGFLKMGLGSNDLVLSDSGASSATVSGQNYVANQPIYYRAIWDRVTSGTLTLSNMSQGLSSSNTCASDIDNYATYFYIACNPAMSNDVLDGFIQDIKFYDVP